MTKHLSYHVISEGQESGIGLSRWFCLKASPEAAVKLWADVSGC